jgi:hypothetical protein
MAGHSTAPARRTGPRLLQVIQQAARARRLLLLRMPRQPPWHHVCCTPNACSAELPPPPCLPAMHARAPRTCGVKGQLVCEHVRGQELHQHNRWRPGMVSKQQLAQQPLKGAHQAVVDVAVVVAVVCAVLDKHLCGVRKPGAPRGWRWATCGTAVDAAARAINGPHGRQCLHDTRAWRLLLLAGAAPRHASHSTLRFA